MPYSRQHARFSSTTSSPTSSSRSSRPAFELLNEETMTLRKKQVSYDNIAINQTVMQESKKKKRASSCGLKGSVLCSIDWEFHFFEISFHEFASLDVTNLRSTLVIQICMKWEKTNDRLFVSRLDIERLFKKIQNRSRMFRIVHSNKLECYATLTIMHDQSSYHPIPNIRLNITNSVSVHSNWRKVPGVRNFSGRQDDSGPMHSMQLVQVQLRPLCPLCTPQYAVKSWRMS